MSLRSVNAPSRPRRGAPVPALALAALVAGLVAAFALVALAAGAMRSTKIAPGVCETSGGGRFVDIPGFPGEMIDRRLLDDVRMLVRRYKIFVNDGYSMSEIHAANGEHPIGLALDIVPNKAAGGTWAQLDRLALWAEPKQNEPRSPFRWVGYDGDVNHGRGNHLHLSWNHSEVKPGRTARTVYTVRCPGSTNTPKPPQPEPQPPTGGGAIPGTPTIDDDGQVTVPPSGSGGIGGIGGPKPRLGPPVAETGGADR